MLEPLITDRLILSGQTWILSRRRENFDTREVKNVTCDLSTL